MLHQLHLVVSKQLGRLSGHYASIAKVVNVWRSVGVPWKIFELYTAKFGSDQAKVVRRLPPRPLKGRWGSISSAEEYLLQARPTDLPAIFKCALGTVENVEDGDIAAALLDSAGDIDNATYRKIMGRWRRDAIAALEDPMFWAQVLISFNSKRPLNHLMRFLMTVDNGSSSGQTSKPCGKLPALVYGKLRNITDEFAGVLNPDAICWKGLWLDVLARLTDEAAADTVRCLVASTLEIGSELEKRVASVVNGFPAQLAWLILEQPGEFCEHRLKCCSEFLAKDPTVPWPNVNNGSKFQGDCDCR